MDSVLTQTARCLSVLIHCIMGWRMAAATLSYGGMLHRRGGKDGDGRPAGWDPNAPPRGFGKAAENVLFRFVEDILTPAQR